MYFKPFIFSTLIICCFAFVNAQASNTVTVKNTVAKNVAATAVSVNAQSQSNTAEITDVPQSQSMWLFRNEFAGTSGFPSTRLLANDDPIGGKTCELADDLPVPVGETWSIDTIRSYLFWYKFEPDLYEVNIYDDDGYGFPAEPAKYNFTFTASLPDELTLYIMDLDVTPQNIELPGGEYWLSVIGVYNDKAMADTAMMLWNRLDTLEGNRGALARDSVGLCYTSYPNNWLTIAAANENPENSLRFWIRGTKETAINNAMQQNVGAKVLAYPNPATEFVSFTLNNSKGKYIEMYDVLGKLVQRVDLKKSSNKASVKNIKNGVYTYRVIGDAGRIIDKGRFTVSK